MERNEFQSSARLSRAAVAQWRKEIATNRNCFSQVPSSAAAFEEKSARLSFLTIPDPRKGDRQREREREREREGGGRERTKPGGRRSVKFLAGAKPRKSVIYKINIRQSFSSFTPANAGRGSGRVALREGGRSAGRSLKPRLQKRATPKPESTAESLEFTAPTYWLRRHTKLRLVKHPPDTRPVSPSHHHPPPLPSSRSPAASSHIIAKRETFDNVRPADTVFPALV